MSNTQAISDPVAITKSTAAALGLEAIDHRRGMGALSAPSVGSTSGTLSGVFPGGTAGAGVSNDLQGFVSSGLTVTHNAGHFGVDRGAGSLYLGMVYSAVAVTLDQGDASNPRYDLLVLRVRDPGLTGEGSVTESAKIVILKGTPAAVPTIPTGLMTNGDLALTAFRVGYGSNSTTISEVLDQRLFIVARGGITPGSSADNRAGSYEGQYRDDPDSESLQRWSGTDWQSVASAAVWTSFTPKLFATDGGECSLGTSGTALGRYIVVGKLMHIRYDFRAVRPCNMRTGFIYTKLPADVKSAKSGESHIYAKVNTPGGIFPGEAFIAPDGVSVQPYFPNSSSDTRINAYRVAVTAGTVGQSTPNNPNEYADPYVLIIQGTIEVQ